MGIFASQSIWASSVFHLNDAREYLFAVDVLRETLRGALKAQNSAMNPIYGKLLEELEGLGYHAGLQIYVASFSEERDLLSQWLAYGSGTNAYSIGFRRAHFREAFRQGFALIKCVYNESEQSELAWSMIKALTHDALENGLGDVEALPAALLAAAAMKHSGFKQEAEWRLVRMGAAGWLAKGDIRYRAGRNGIVPYLEVPLLRQKDQFRPDVITLGPNDNMDVAELAMETYLGTNNMRSFFGERRPAIQRSKTPYRP